MVRTALATLVLVSQLAAVGAAQEWARKMLSANSHDFGPVARGAKVEHHFTITNIYKEDVHIAAVRSSCGCTSARVTQQSLKTFEKSELVAELNTRTFQGDKSATVTVTFDKPFRAEVQVQITGYIRTDVVLEPGSVDLGAVAHGAPVEKQIAISYAGRDDWQITDVKTANPHLSAELVETERGSGRVKYNLLVKLADDAPVGYLREQLILLTNDARATQLPVDVEGKVEAEISVSPAPLFMGILKPGEKKDKVLVVKSKKPFRILAITCEDKSFTFKVPEDAKAMHNVPVTFEAGTEPGKLSQKVRIETDLGDSDVPEVLVYAQVVAKE